MAENTPKTTKIDTAVPKRRSTYTDKPSEDNTGTQETQNPTGMPEGFHEPAVTIEDVQRTFASPEQKMRTDLEQWWLDLAHTEINALLPKVIEYGGVETDAGLIGMGRDIVEAGFPMPEFLGTEEQRKSQENEFYAELAIYTYMQGKMARWKSALRRGVFVGDDTVYDLGIYSRMVQRIRDVGGWPS